MTTVRDERVWKGDQSLFGSRVVMWGASSGLFRARIRRDCYDNQSTAVVEAWCQGRGWREVQTVPIHDLAIAAKSYAAKPGTWESLMRASLETLCELGIRLLKGS